MNEHRHKSLLVITSLFRYNVALKRRLEMPKKEKLGLLNAIRDRVKDFQHHRKKLFVKDQEVPLENELLRVNQKISFEFD